MRSAIWSPEGPGMSRSRTARRSRWRSTAPARCRRRRHRRSPPVAGHRGSLRPCRARPRRSVRACLGCWQLAHIVGISKNRYVLATRRCLQWRCDLQTTRTKRNAPYPNERVSPALPERAGLCSACPIPRPRGVRGRPVTHSTRCTVSPCVGPLATAGTGALWCSATAAGGRPARAAGADRQPGEGDDRLPDPRALPAQRRTGRVHDHRVRGAGAGRRPRTHARASRSWRCTSASS